jgi:HAD superfamily hydrolase (TIGR01549 family)
MIKAVLFDVDGVLVDSLEGNAKYFSHVLQRFGGSPLSGKDYKSYYHLPARKVFSHFFPEKTESEIADMMSYGASVVERFFRFMRLNPHAAETLEGLGKRYRLGVVTSRRAMGILDYLKVRRHFEVVVGYHDTGSHKPHPEPLLLAVGRMSLKPEEAVYVGDSESDAQAARAAGVRIVSYRNPGMGADADVEDLAELPAVLEKLRRKQGR